AVTLLDLMQQRPPGKTEIEVEAAYLFRAQIFRRRLRAQRRHRDRRIDVVEGLYRTRRIEYLLVRGNAIRKIRAHQRDVGIAQVAPYLWQGSFPIRVESQLTEIRMGQVTVVAIPIGVALVEHDLVIA